MAFNVATLSEVRALGNNRWHWHYFTSDSLGTVLADGYFPSTYMHVGDIIEVAASSGAAYDQLGVTSITGSVKTAGLSGEARTPQRYGARGDGVEVTGATSIASSAAALTVAGAAFTSADVGKAILVPGAGASGAVLATTIAAYVSATQVTLAATAGTTLSAVSKAVTYGTDDTTALQAWLTAGGGTLPPGTYITTAALVPPSGSAIVGPGSMLAEIRCSTTPVIGWTRLAAKSDILIRGVKLNTTRSSFEFVLTNLDDGIICGDFTSLTNVTVEDCEITAPTAMCHGISLYPMKEDGTNAIDNIHIRRNYIHDVGGCGAAFVNNIVSPLASRMTNIFFTDNKVKNCGLKTTPVDGAATYTGDYGQGITCSGLGNGFHICRNYFNNYQYNGIEIVGQSQVEVTENLFENVASTVDLIHQTGSNRHGGNIFRGNKTLGTAAVGQQCLIYYSDRTVWRDNDLYSAKKLVWRDNDDGLLEGGRYKCADTSAIFLEHTSSNECKRNIARAMIFDNDGGGASNNCVILANTSSVKNNTFEDCTIIRPVGQGNYIGDTVGGGNNRLRRCHILNGAAGTMTPFVESIFSTTLSDANSTLAESNAQRETIQFNGTLTAQRDITLPPVDRAYTVFNNTAQTLRFKFAAGTLTSVVAAAVKRLSADYTNQAVTDISS